MRFTNKKATKRFLLFFENKNLGTFSFFYWDNNVVLGKKSILSSLGKIRRKKDKIKDSRFIDKIGESIATRSFIVFCAFNIG